MVLTMFSGLFGEKIKKKFLLASMKLLTTSENYSNSKSLSRKFVPAFG
jgi:hypothetical protein